MKDSPPLNEWTTMPVAWAAFTQAHPELGLNPGYWSAHNFLRDPHRREHLQQVDALRRANNRHWIAHRDRFNAAAFDLITGRVKEVAA